MYARVDLTIYTQSSMIYIRVLKDGRSEDLYIINHKTNINML